MLRGELDMPAIALITAAISTMLSIVFVHQWYTNRTFMTGLGWWCLAPVIAFFGALLTGTQDTVPFIISIVVANACSFSSSVAFYIGSKRFFGEKAPKWPWLLLLVVSSGLYIFAIEYPDFRGRLLIFASAQIFLQSAQLAVFHRHRKRTFASYFLRSSTILALTIFIARLATIGMEGKDATLFTPSLVHNMYLAGFGFWGISQTIGIVLIVQEALRDRVEELALRDALTGLLGRGAIFSLGLAAMRSHQQAREPMSVLLMDLDHFKNTNDTYGHIVGDNVLRDFGRRVEACLRPGDLIGRYGGEEFLAILPGASTAEAKAVAERILQSGPTADLPLVTVSIGIATSTQALASAEPHEAFEQLVDTADRALYQAKQGGRNRVVAADPDLLPRTTFSRHTGTLNRLAGQSWSSDTYSEVRADRPH